MLWLRITCVCDAQQLLTEPLYLLELRPDCVLLVGNVGNCGGLGGKVLEMGGILPVGAPLRVGEATRGYDSRSPRPTRHVGGTFVRASEFQKRGGRCPGWSFPGEVAAAPSTPMGALVSLLRLQLAEDCPHSWLAAVRGVELIWNKSQQSPPRLRGDTRPHALSSATCAMSAARVTARPRCRCRDTGFSCVGSLLQLPSEQ